MNKLAWPIRRKRLVRRGLICLLGLSVLGVIAAWVVGGRLIAASQSVVGQPPKDLPGKSFTLSSESGSTIHGWHLPHASSKGVVLLLHPIRGSRLSMLERARVLHSAGYSLILIDLQAHGESQGANITLGYLERFDVRAAVEFARRMHPNEPIGIVGVSLGGASTLLASPLEIDALVLESVYPDIHAAVSNRVAAKLGPLSSVPTQLLLWQLNPRLGISPVDLRPIDHLGDFHCPIFLMCGTQDRHTTVEETEAMFAIIPQPKELWLVKDAAHEDLQQAAPKEYERRLVNFFDQDLRKPER